MAPVQGVSPTHQPLLALCDPAWSPTPASACLSEIATESSRHPNMRCGPWTASLHRAKCRPRRTSPRPSRVAGPSCRQLLIQLLEQWTDSVAESGNRAVDATALGERDGVQAVSFHAGRLHDPVPTPL